MAKQTVGERERHRRISRWLYSKECTAQTFACYVWGEGYTLALAALETEKSRKKRLRALLMLRAAVAEIEAYIKALGEDTEGGDSEGGIRAADGWIAAVPAERGASLAGDLD